MDMSSGGWLAKFKTLKHDLEHHVDEEEDEVFGLAKSLIDADEAKALGDRFAKLKAEHMGSHEKA